MEALEYGEVQPLLTPSPTTLGKHGYSAWNLRLRALESVEYFVARGYSRTAAQQKVGDAFGRDLETVRDWQKNVRSRLGDLEVARRLAFARNGGLNAEAAKRDGNRNMFLSQDSRYGESALEQMAGKYTALLRDD